MGVYSDFVLDIGIVGCFPDSCCTAALGILGALSPDGYGTSLTRDQVSPLRRENEVLRQVPEFCYKKGCCSRLSTAP